MTKLAHFDIRPPANTRKIPIWSEKFTNVSKLVIFEPK